MSRPIRVLLSLGASVAVVALATACGTERIQVAKSDPNYPGAVLFSQRCSGCHTLSYAATHGSAANVRTREITNGPNFNVRCERPITRVLYAIANGGFSGATMPQNIVVGKDALAVAQFIATYAGRQAPAQQGVTPCANESIGSIPALTTATTATIAATATTGKAAARGTTATGGKTAPRSGKLRAKAAGRRASKKTARR